ncbi:alpha-L-rhamnosidase [Paenibacillus contaminans]|uniref:alpha-L-rhamnosidase n=2 Tax=Paenibacillus contaminans TaxID=450362 RepID=A0A329LUW2_9BACL|nr:alpha-L-rhamnosidase [Paenibacillus contaminans]
MVTACLIFYSTIRACKLIVSAAVTTDVERKMSMRIHHLSTEYLTEPAGLDRRQPRLGWKLASDRRAVKQSAYRILVAASTQSLDRNVGDVWDSGKVEGDRSQHVSYEGIELVSGMTYMWKVMVWDESGHASDWSEPASWSMGLLSRAEWQGKWVGLKSNHAPTHAEPKPAVYLRKGFQTEGRSIRKASLFCAALGAYELYVNGCKISGDRLAPDWTDYNIRVSCQMYDVTDVLNEGDGDNAIGILLGHGWYSGYIGMFGYHRYGKDPRVLVQLNLEYEDGSRQSVFSDPTWKASFGPLVATDYQMGETYDARLEMPGWNTLQYDDTSWTAANVFYEFKGHIVAESCPPVSSVMELKPVSIVDKGNGVWLADMGQNMVGRIRIRLQGEAGTTVTLRHGEALDEKKELYTANLRLTRQTDIFILSGKTEEVYEPHFTLHGFRYVEISGYVGELKPSDLTGVVYHSSLDKTGVLETSHPLLNRLLANIEWTQRGNFISVPTDCPQRDERLGWSGDAQVFFRTSSYFMNVAPFFTKWLTDLTDAQRPTGAFTDFAPFIPGGKTEHGGDMTYDHTASAGWGDAGIIVPWMMYRVYGDTDIIERHYEAMTRWIAFLGEMHPSHLREDLPQFGDWLSIPEAAGLGDFSNVSAFSTTPYDVFGTAYYAYSTGLLAKMASIVGKHDDALRYMRHREEITEAFNRAYVDASGTIKGDTQAAYTMALAMELLPEEKREFAVNRILQLLEQRDWHISTGIHGTRWLLAVLADNGYEEIAYKLLMQTGYPSWFYSVLQGATTIWERWDGWTEEKGFQRPGMNSFNQYALGSVGEWIFRFVGGIDLDDRVPGYKHIRIHPRIGGGLDHVASRYESIQGPISCNWRRLDDRLSIDVSIPAGTTAVVRIPANPGQHVTESGGSLEAAIGLTVSEHTNDAVFVEIGSGDYLFTVSD